MKNLNTFSKHFFLLFLTLWGISNKIEAQVKCLGDCPKHVLFGATQNNTKDLLFLGSWKVEQPNQIPAWLHFNKLQGAGSFLTGTLKTWVDKNTSITPRSVDITFKAGAGVSTIKFTQNGYQLNIANRNIQINANTQTAQVFVYSDVDWEISPNHSDWVKGTRIYASTLSIMVDINKNLEGRSTTIYLKDKQGLGLKDSIVLKQLGMPFMIEPKDLFVEKTTSMHDIFIKAPAKPWMARAYSTWLHLDNMMGNGNDTLKLTIDANTCSRRDAFIVFSNEFGTDTVKIIQKESIVFNAITNRYELDCPNTCGGTTGTCLFKIDKFDIPATLPDGGAFLLPLKITSNSLWRYRFESSDGIDTSAIDFGGITRNFALSANPTNTGRTIKITFTACGFTCVYMTYQPAMMPSTQDFVQDLPKNSFLNSKNEKNINIYPNPVHSNILHIDFFIHDEKTKKVSYQLLDMLGKVILSAETTTNIGQNQVVLEKLDLANGIYFINLQFDNNTAITAHKIIVNQ